MPTEPVSPQEYKRAFRRHAAGVALITADAGDGPVALTATSLVSISAEPPYLGFSISDTPSAAATLKSAETVVVHLLGADHIDLARLGATSGADRFGDRSRWQRLPTGEPVFPEAPTWMRARITERLRLGSSTFLVGLVVETSLAEGVLAPLIYQNRRWLKAHRID